MTKLETGRVIELETGKLSDARVNSVGQLTAKAVREGAETETINVNPPLATFGSKPAAVSNVQQPILTGDSTFHGHKNGNGFSTQVNTHEDFASTVNQEQAQVKNIYSTEPVRHEGRSPFGGRQNFEASLAGVASPNRIYLTRDPSQNTAEARNRAYVRAAALEATLAA